MIIDWQTGSVDQNPHAVQFGFIWNYAPVISEDFGTPVDCWTARLRRTDWEAEQRRTDWEARE